MPGLVDQLASIFGGGAPAAPDLLGTGVPPGAVSSTIAPSTTASSTQLPAAPQVLARVRTEAPAATWQGGVKNFTSPLGKSLGEMKVNPGDKLGAFAQGFGRALAAGAEQANEEAKLALAREKQLRDAAQQLFDNNLKTRTANREDAREGRQARKDEDDSEAGGITARTKSADRMGLQGAERKSYIAEGTLGKEAKERNPNRIAYYRSMAIESRRRALGLTADDKLKSSPSYIGSGGMTADQRTKAEAELEKFKKSLDTEQDEDAPSRAPKARDNAAASSDTAPAPARAPAPQGTATPSAPATPAAPGPAAAASAATPAPPQYIRNRATGEVRQLDPATGEYVPMGGPTEAPPG